jgi:protein gp37
MGQDSAIEWTDHTFNPWTGCTKISPACANCYAEAWAKRTGIVQWGDSAARRRTSESNWRQPLIWDREAAQVGVRKRVFCASLADVFEDRDELKPWRRDLIRLILSTHNLDWLLLTKRPENILRMMNESAPRGSDYLIRQRLWLGTTVESPDYYKRINRLIQCRMWASVLFLSCEPLLAGLDLRWWLWGGEGLSTRSLIDWVIGGFESGPRFRAGNEEHAIDLQEQRADAGVPFLWKQNGGRTPKAGGCLLNGREYKEFPRAA